MSYGVYGRGQQITLVRRRPKNGPARFDDYGNVQYDVTAEIVRGVAIWPTSVTENDAVQFERTTSYYSACLPPAVAIGSVDYVLWDGKKFEVSGEPSQYRSPHTGSAFQVITLKRVEG